VQRGKSRRHQCLRQSCAPSVWECCLQRAAPKVFTDPLYNARWKFILHGERRNQRAGTGCNNIRGTTQPGGVASSAASPAPARRQLNGVDYLGGVTTRAA